MGQHTAGPWFAVGDEIHDRETKFDESGSRIGSTPNLICTVAGVPPVEYMGNKEANARRIVACVNALEGISTENVERVWNDKPYGALECAALAEENAELLATLEEADRDFEREGFGVDSPYRSPIRAAIAKAKRG